MADDPVAKHVFLDTEVFVRFGFKYTSTPFRSLINLVATGRLRLVITNVALREVESRIDRAIQEAGDAHRRFSKEARVLGSSQLATVAGKVEKLDSAAAAQDLKVRFRQFLAETNALTIETRDVEVDDVMDDYFAGKPPFDTSEKKAEFPDAFTIKALADWSESQEEPILVVSGDRGVREACEPLESLVACESIQDMLDGVANDNEKVAALLRDHVNANQAEITKRVITEFEDRYFFVVDENGDAEVTVEDATLLQVDVLEMKDQEAIVEVVFRVRYEAEVSYDDPDMTSYDSETGESLSWGTRETTVHRSTRVRAEVTLDFDGLDSDAVEINDVIVTEPSDSFVVPLYDPRDDK